MWYRHSRKKIELFKRLKDVVGKDNFSKDVQMGMNEWYYIQIKEKTL